ncbi:hypothetical protein K466DRAFT_655129 [Polyporus arcularius HHB13444]|uniref:Uncharacterized protein n=1 Tax=Polyporus arcularius HHB13444 TaxID=1314778 RepID=A0A5C3P1T4_9APHY|nr:hypothetical protein K466DRAFT_655129 [Polyporus arcularius HHB13444]
MSPSPSPRRRLPNPRPKRDAYEAFSSPEANWSTIPTKKGRLKTSTKAGRPREATTKPFKMPVTLGSALTGRGEAMERSSAKAKVTTYLPPPRKNRPQAETVSPKDGFSLSPFAYRPPRSPSKQQHASSANVPTSPLFQPMAIRRAPAQPLSLSTYRCSTPAREPQRQPSPARPSHASASSDTLSSDGWPYDEWDAVDSTMPFDTPTLARRYPFVRRGVAESRLGKFS